MPPSATLTSAPSASNVISPATSTVKSPLDKSISVPSIVILSIATPELITGFCEKVTTPPEEIANASVSEAEPILPASAITTFPPDTILLDVVKTPAELKLIFSAAASEAAVLKLNFVALIDELKSPSETADIPAATNIASVPVPSSGA